MPLLARVDLVLRCVTARCPRLDDLSRIERLGVTEDDEQLE